MLGKRLEYFRESRGLTKRQMSDLIGTTEQNYGHLVIAGVPKFDLFQRICDRLMVDGNWIIGRDAPIWYQAMTRKYRDHLLATVKANSYPERVVLIIRELHHLEPERFTHTMLAALSCMPEREIVPLLNGDMPRRVRVQIGSALSEVFEFPFEWLHE